MGHTHTHTHIYIYILNLPPSSTFVPPGTSIQPSIQPTNHQPQYPILSYPRPIHLKDSPSHGCISINSFIRSLPFGLAGARKISPSFWVVNIHCLGVGWVRLLCSVDRRLGAGGWGKEVECMYASMEKGWGSCMYRESWNGCWWQNRTPHL